MSSSSSNNHDVDTINNNNNMVHWAIIGLGDVCAVKSGPAFYKCNGSTLSAVMRRTPNAAQQWIQNNANNLPNDVAQSIRAFDNIESMIHEMMTSSNGSGSVGLLDAIYVSSPPGAHLDNIKQIVNAVDALPTKTTTKLYNGKIKAVYVEKPCGRCAWETRAMIHELNERNIQFYPAYVSRAHERTQYIRNELLKKNVIGEKITSVKYTQRGSSLARGLNNDNADDNTIPWRLNAEQSGGGLIMDMGCHILDRIDYLFGPIQNVKSTVLRKGGSRSTTYPLVEDYVSMNATIGECTWSAINSVGAKVECTWDFSPRDEEDNDDKDEVDELVITGTKGSLRMAGMGAGQPIDVLDINGELIRTIEFHAPKHAALPLIQSIVNELRGLDKAGDDGSGSSERNCLVQSPARADNAVRTSEVLDSILGTYYGGRHDEFWSRPPDTWPGLVMKKT